MKSFFPFITKYVDKYIRRYILKNRSLHKHYQIKSNISRDLFSTANRRPRIFLSRIAGVSTTGRRGDDGGGDRWTNESNRKSSASPRVKSDRGKGEKMEPEESVGRGRASRGPYSTQGYQPLSIH